MQLLSRTFQDRDLGHLRVVAELWGLDLPPGAAGQAVTALSLAMLNPSALAEVVDALPPQAREALDEMVRNAGRLPLADLERRYGPLREMGPGRRDREKPWRSASPIEALWYRGLLGRAFAETPAGPQEFGFVPADLLPLLPLPTSRQPGAPGKPAQTPAWQSVASLAAAEDATTILSALRRRPSRSLPLPSERRRHLTAFLLQPASIDLLVTLIRQEGLLGGPPFRPEPEAVRHFLDASPVEVVNRLRQAWMRSPGWNDLQHVPDLEAPSGQWPNDPVPSRQAVLDLLARVPADTWWDVDAFVEAVHQQQPGFQRPAGDFDSWYLRSRSTGEFLRGFEHWTAVDGALLRLIITGPLHWFGVTDIGSAQPDAPASAFRISTVLTWAAMPQQPLRPGALTPEGRLVMPDGSSRVHRYQVSRVCSWEPLDAEGWHYRLTAASLEAARAQGLQISHVRSILESAIGGHLPPVVSRTLERWEARGTEARLERSIVLRVKSPGVLKELRENRPTARYLGESLGPTSAMVAERDWERLRAAAWRLGIVVHTPDTEEPG